ncbi:hypothetical protein HWB05_gp053 [Streptomyces phage BRock]|uniref:Uncharacterized protein n=1 Tax=Streptomyces phage BRock TaxID=1913591 RepID=A0A1J0GVW2_9CAUD|nr:hypothetical protein HWB05_gp053 [Streptomyces phage BRock]APC46315.1 hypothetical protein [Streptomyces phage BRock]
MSEQLTGAPLAETIKNITIKLPSLHDQTTWFWTNNTSLYALERDGTPYRVDADIVHLNDILELIDTEDPEDKVDCGATLCAAGWACILNGYSLETVKDGYKYVTWAVKDGKHYEIQKLGADLLELSEYDAEKLFLSTNDEEAIDALEIIAKGGKLDWSDIIQEREDEEDDDDYDDDPYNDYDY